MMNRATKIILISFILITLLHNAVAQESSCSRSASLIQKSKYRAEAGFTPVDNRITEVYAEVTCKAVDVYVWGVHNNDSGEFNEVDIGVGYTYSINDFSYRIVYERWEYPESTGNNDVVIGLLVYRGWPVIARLKWTVVTEDSGQLMSAVFIKPVVLNKTDTSSLKLIPGLRINCVDGYFGATDCPSNIVYSVRLMASNNSLNYGLIIDFHDGKGRFGDTTNLGLLIGVDF